ncbi:haloacid dehalogenase [Trichodelitschia bisporula]|uniref:Haloacid dehalogenase n=1 Tax=Trichodelitschia bisporula TaxID=703511 RepID=A0A6G1HUY7_9PEZI|nr:haloacid dehalogenase [Trichodelitschia bisporula]
MGRNIILAFDLYGTLLSTASIASRLANYVGQEKASSIAAKWRLYQLEYTWRLTSMKQYEPFSVVTRRSLKHALAETKVHLEDEAIDSLMEAYDTLSAFPDVKPALESLANVPNCTSVIFSNGTHPMVSSSIYQSQDLSPHAGLFQDIVVVEEAQKFKPAPETYELLLEQVGKSKADMEDVWLISSNPFDIVGARAVGLKAAWVDREGNGWVDAVVEGELGGPTIVVKSLGEVVDAVRRLLTG